MVAHGKGRQKVMRAQKQHTVSRMSTLDLPEQMKESSHSNVQNVAGAYVPHSGKNVLTAVIEVTSPTMWHQGVKKKPNE